jgi:pimeloyl-ACP methyl ester carboxylesterase
MQIEFAEVSFEGRSLRLEYAFLNAERRAAPLLVFLHEGLGTPAMWRDFPQQLCDAGGFRGLLYSRYGYGGSTARPAKEQWPLDYLEREARQLLPNFLRAVGADARPWLFGHSDGASIALIHAGGSGRPLAGLVLMAPHVLVEDVSVASIAAARVAYETTDLRAKLARHHADVDSAFRGWNRIWLHPDFRPWNIEEYLPRIDCPVLAIQGEDDEYGTMEQMRCIGARVPDVELLRLEDCRHSAHKDQPEAVIDAVTRFVDRVTA